MVELKDKDIEILGWKGIVPHLTLRIYYEVEKSKQREEALKLKKIILEWQEFYNSAEIDLKTWYKQIKELKEKAEKLPKVETKLKMMEISFEQTNNSRNDLIKQLGEQELLNETLQNEIKCLKVKADDWSEMNKETLKYRKKLEELLKVKK